MKRVFISFAKEDIRLRDLLGGQARIQNSPFEYVDMSIKQPWDSQWKTNCRIRIKGCDGMIAIISQNTRNADRQIWEIKCAQQEGIPVLGIYGNNTHVGSIPTGCEYFRIVDWTWSNISDWLKALQRRTSMENDESKNELLLAQWQTCVEMANSISQRRDTMNNIFVTLNLAIMAAISIVWNIKSILILVAGIVVCILWLLFIRNYKQLNAAKFDVINGIEKNLPARPFCKEWEELTNNKKYRDGTKLEKSLPIMFIALYIITAIVIVVIKLNAGGTL